MMNQHFSTRSGGHEVLIMRVLQVLKLSMMLWFDIILGLNFLSLCVWVWQFLTICLEYRQIKLQLSIKLNNIDKLTLIPVCPVKEF